MKLPAFPRPSLPLFAFLLAMAPATYALPTTNPLPGISGLGIIPTTDTVPAGVPEIALGYERVDLDEVDGEVDLLPLASVIYGFEKGEVGATYVRESSDIEGFSLRNSYYAVQGKFHVFARQNAKISLGAHYFDFGKEGGADLGTVLSGYATASVDLRGRSGNAGRGARAHGGLLVQRARRGGSGDTLFRPFAGLEYGFTPDVWLAADYLTSDEDAPRAYTLSVRYLPPQSPFSAQIGAGKLRRDTKFFVGASYRFGRAATR